MNERNVQVFLGPSMPLREARGILAATYLPPVAMGDVYGAVRAGADVIAIIDGVFEQVPSVFHKEIIFALEQGVEVWGASSMGALRAAELHPFGMRGVGRVFERYRDRLYEDDDEVAVAHAPATDGWRPLSDAMVNIRETLARARAAQEISPDTVDRLIAVAKGIYYPERSWTEVWARVGDAVPASELARARAYVEVHAVNLKRDDARELLLAVAEASVPPRAEPPVALEKTIFWQRLVDDRERVSGGAGEASAQEELRRFALVNSNRRREMLRLALLDLLATAEARRVGLRVEAEDVQAAADRFRRERSLNSGQDLGRWIHDNGLDVAEFTRLMQMEATLDGMVLHHARSLQARVLDVLRRQGRFSELRKEYDRNGAHLRHLGIDRPTLEDAGTPLDGVLSWYSNRFGPLCGAPDEEAKLLGFETQLDYVTEVLATYLANRTDA
jgi:hypothetical protein